MAAGGPMGGRRLGQSDKAATRRSNDRRGQPYNRRINRRAQQNIRIDLGEAVYLESKK
jgi:hypothetical protein